MGFLKMLGNMLSAINESARKQQIIDEQENSIIASATQRDNQIYIYNPKGNMIGCISGYELVGFTSTTVTARPFNEKHSHYIFDAKGNHKGGYCI